MSNSLVRSYEKTEPGGFIVVTARLALLTVFAGAALTACSRAVDRPPAFPIEACHRVALTDSVTGVGIIGAEDLVPDFRNDRIFISAYDRRAVEKAAREKSYSLPQGGVYSVSIADLASGAESIDAQSLLAPETVAGGLRPHGLSYDEQLHEISFINRSYVKVDGAWKMTPRVERISTEGAAFVGDAGTPPCAANDIVTIGQSTFVSFDHASCGAGAAFENLFGLRRSGVADINGAPLFNRALFANGILAADDGGIVLAATREKSLLVLNSATDQIWRIESRIRLPGAPDNLTRSQDGGVVAAVHPSLWRTGAHRRLGWRLAPSRIVKTNIETGDAELLFDDPSGRLFSAATVAVETGDLLIAGSATDRGLLVCDKGALKL